MRYLPTAKKIIRRKRPSGNPGEKNGWGPTWEGGWRGGGGGRACPVLPPQKNRLPPGKSVVDKEFIERGEVRKAAPGPPDQRRGNFLKPLPSPTRHGSKKTAHKPKETRGGKSSENARWEEHLRTSTPENQQIQKDRKGKS